MRKLILSVGLVLAALAMSVVPAVAGSIGPTS